MNKMKIPGLWDILMQREVEIARRDTSAPIAFGINIMGPEFEDTHVFDYIAVPVTTRWITAEGWDS